MHKTRYNALRLTLAISPRGPLLVKAGGVSANPSLPDMQFVRTAHATLGEIVYIPGSSLKGVVRGFAEKALRTLDDRNTWRWACPTFPDEPESCAKRLENEKSSATVYHRSCGACRIFGHTRLRGRASFTDLFPVDEVVTETRYGVAISRLTHAVAHGPFEMEVAVSGTFEGHLVLENYEIWQLGLLASALEAMNQGLVKVGFGKNRGFGEVEVTVKEARVDEVASGAETSALRGLSAFVDESEQEAYGLFPPATLDGLPDPNETLALGIYTRRAYDNEGWQAIAQKAIAALSTG
jgi:CRISPR-associated RAMP protein (TIGR02581 family)